MAVFNPNPPDVNPTEYLKYSKSIQQPESDKSLGITLAGLGNAAESLTNLADSTVRDVIKADLYKRIDEKRDNFNDTLSAALNPPAQSDSPANQPLSLTQEPSATPPTGVTRSIKRAGAIQLAYDGGKATETQYYKDLNTIAQSVRSEFPGWREYVDSEVSKITGVNPANALIQSQIQDYNRAITKTQSEQEKVNNFIRQHSDVTGFEQMIDYYKRTGDEGAVYRWGGAADQKKAELQNLKLGYEAVQAGNNLKIDKAAKYGTATVDHYVNDAFINSRLVQGNTEVSKTPAELADTFTKIATGVIPYPGDEAMENLRNNYEAARVDAANKIHATIFTPNPKTGRSVADDWGVDAANTYIKTSLDAAFGATSQFISKKDFSLAESNQRRVAGSKSDAAMSVLQSDAGAEARLSQGLAAIDPQVSPVVFGKIMNTPDKKGLTYLNRLNLLVEHSVLGAIVQPNLARTGKPNTMAQAMDDAKAGDKASGGNGNSSEVAVAFQTFSDVYKVVTDPKTNDASKKNALTFLFDPSNSGKLLQKIMPEGVGADGKTTKGQIDFYEAITNEKLTKSVMEYSKRTGDKQSWQNYSNLAKNEFGIKLKTDIQNLNNLQDSGTLYGSQWHYAYDNDSKQFIPLHADETPLNTSERTWFNPAYRTVDTINRAMDNLKNIAKAEGSNVDAFLFKTLQEGGWDPFKEIQGVPSKLMRAIIEANHPNTLKGQVTGPISK